MDKQRQWEEDFLKKIYDKFYQVVDEIETISPRALVENGKYPKEKNPPYTWVGGFWGGILWWLYRYSGEEKFLQKGKEISDWMEQGLLEYNHLTHDVGFEYLLTSVADYMETSEQKPYFVGLHAAALLAGRYNPAGRYIRAWNENKYIDGSESKAGYAIIDCMMNIPLLFWATEESGDPRYRQIAMLHADTAMREFIRENGSSEHIVVFDPESGAVVNKPEGQGYARGSSWTRGQGWAIYGFAMAYHYTKKQEYLDTALKVAAYFLSRLPENGMPPVDFDQPAEPAFIDMSAAAIAVCGMIDLKKWVRTEEEEWLEKGIRMLLGALYENCDFSVENQALVENCKQMYHEEPVQQHWIYGDFYLVEALMKRRGESYIFDSKVCE